jgi:hypothetical protein
VLIGISYVSVLLVVDEMFCCLKSNYDDVCVQEADESLNFDEMILEAAKSIAAATSALVKAASAAQRELIDLGKV